jgi:plasmid maintenance system antidote protein VapI
MEPRPVVIVSPELIRRELARTDLKTLDALAKRAAIRPATISDVMAERPVSAETIYRLGLALGLAVVVT